MYYYLKNSQGDHTIKARLTKNLCTFQGLMVSDGIRYSKCNRCKNEIKVKTLKRKSASHEKLARKQQNFLVNIFTFWLRRLLSYIKECEEKIKTALKESYT